MALFFPHLMLAQGLTAEAAGEALVLAQCEHTPSRFTADRLVIGRSPEGLRWTVEGEVRFCGEPVPASSAGGASPKDPARSGKSRR